MARPKGEGRTQVGVPNGCLAEVRAVIARHRGVRATDTGPTAGYAHARVARSPLPPEVAPVAIFPVPANREKAAIFATLLAASREGPEALVQRVEPVAPAEPKDDFVEPAMCYYPDEDSCSHCGANNPEDGPHHNLKICRRHPDNPRYSRNKK